MTIKQVKCYASQLGGCSDKQSGEHPLPKGIWKNSLITFEGFGWQQGNAHTLPIRNVNQRILCTTHNTDLSYIDGLGKKFFRILERFQINQSARRTFKRSAIWRVDRESINGHLLEKLFTKIGVGFAHDRKTATWHSTGEVVTSPPRRVLDVLFNNDVFEFPMGLYSITQPSDEIQGDEHFELETLDHPETGRIIGFLLGFRRYQFFLNLSDLNMTHYSFMSLTGRRMGKGGASPLYRPSQFRMNAGPKLSGVVTFNWA